MLSLIASLGLLVAACGGGGSSGAALAPAPLGLRVPNFFGANVLAFDARRRSQSGAPNPAVKNSSAAIDSPEETLFDASGNLWITCGFSILGPPGFIGGFDRLRIGFVQGDAGKRLSLLCGSNSLLRRKNSLFLQNNSLFG
jgi:hypothetical protein